MINNQESDNTLNDSIAEELDEFLPEAEKDENQGTVSTFASFLVLLKAIVCSGVLVLPSAFRSGGSIVGSVVFCIIGALTAYGFVLIVECKNKVGGTFGEIAEKAFGKIALYAVEFSLVISQLGFCATYLIFCANLSELFFGVWILNCSAEWQKIPYFALIAIQFIILAPMLVIRKVNILAIPSLFANGIIIFCLASVTYFGLKTIADEGVKELAFWSASFPQFIGTAVFSYEGIAMILPLQSAMKNKGQFKMLVWVTISGITLFFIAFCVICNLAWGDTVKTIVLENMPQATWFTQIASIIYVVAVLLTFPIQFFPAILILEPKMQKWIELLLAGYSSKDEYDETLIETPKNDSLKLYWIQNMIRFVLLLFVIGVSILGSSQLDGFVSLIGAICCIPLAFIYPAIFHYKLVAENNYDKFADIFLIIFGILAMIGSSILVLYKWITENHPHIDPCFNSTNSSNLTFHSSL